jgi:hypothetical protein
MPPGRIDRHQKPTKDKAIIRKDDEGVIWIGEKPAS